MWLEQSSFPWLTGEWRWRTGVLRGRPILQVLEAREKAHRTKGKYVKYKWRDATFQDLSNPMLRGILSNPNLSEQDVQRRLVIAAVQ
jgi:hypothetical protein